MYFSSNYIMLVGCPLNMRHKRLIEGDTSAKGKREGGTGR